MSRLLTRTAFVNWLKAKQPDTIVGKADNTCECPLATFLTETHEIAYIVDSDFYIMKDIDNTRTPLPYWAHRFVEKVDGLNSSGVSITAAQALSYL